MCANNISVKAKLFMALTVVFLIALPVASAHPDYQIASILRGEAPVDCEACRQLTACALLEDAGNGVHLPSRWYGWRNARTEDYTMIEWGRQAGNYQQYPSCKFVGSGRDLETWARNGWIDSTVRSIAYCGKTGCTVCVPRMEMPTMAE